MKTIFAAVKAVFVLLMAFSISVLNAQDETSIKSLIESKRFVFKVQTIMPLSGAVRQSLIDRMKKPSIKQRLLF